MTPEAEARQQIDERLQKADWFIQSLKQLNIKECYIYNLQINMHFTFKQHSMTFADLQDFINCFNHQNRQERYETWNEANPEGRFRRYTIDDILVRDKTSLDIFWIKDRSLPISTICHFLMNSPPTSSKASKSALASFQSLNDKLEK